MLNFSELPVLAEADVVIAGAGPGGIGAAVMAARAGAKVILLEHYGLPGGMAAIGEVHPFMPNHCNDVPLDAPVYGEWLNAMLPYHNDSEQQKIAAEEGMPRMGKLRTDLMCTSRDQLALDQA